MLDPTQHPLNPSQPIRLGFVPLVDAAPLIVAKEFGLFADAGLHVALVREPGWATVRDKLVLGRELDGAHALAGLAFATSYGLGCVSHHCLTGYVLNRHGNGVTLSKALWEAGVRNPSDLRDWTQGSQGRMLRFGIVHPASTHHFLLRSMLGRAGLKVGEHAEVVVLPPELMPSNLENGRIDGFCAGEPWNTVATSGGSGFCVATSSELCQGHSEKVLLVTSEFEKHSHAEHLALIGALSAAGEICDDREHRNEVAHLLTFPPYLDLPFGLIRNSLGDTFDRGFQETTSSDDFHAFTGKDVNRPTADKADLVLSQLRDCGLIKGRRPAGPAPKDIFRSDLYDEAVASTRSAPAPGMLAV